jgi:hypothetical protein
MPDLEAVSRFSAHLDTETIDFFWLRSAKIVLGLLS